MKSYGAIAIFLIFYLISGCASHTRLNSFFFIQMADTQFGFFTDNQDFAKETINFEKAIAAANRLQPAFVVICGDLVNKPGDDKQIAEYKRIASTLNPAIKLFHVAGNHDVGNIPTPASLQRYRQDLGPDYYTFESGNVLGIVLNSSLMRAPDSSYLESVSQEQWLQSALERAQNSDKLIMVFQHHSLFLADPEEPDEYFNFPKDKRRVYLDLFKKYHVKFIFAGHYHRNALGRADDMEMITTGPVGKPLGSDPSGVRIVVVAGEVVKHSYYSFDAIPKTVDFD